MNEESAKHAIKSFLDTNAATFTSGITIQGAARSIAHVAISQFAVPGGGSGKSYPFIRITCPRAWLHEVDTTGNMLLTKSRYEIIVHVHDEALLQSGDDTPFETMDSDFRTMCDRMVNLIISTLKFSYNSVNFELVTDDESPIEKENTDAWMVGPEDTIQALMFGARITFTLQEC